MSFIATTAVLALLGTAAAVEHFPVTLFLPDFDQQPLVASIVGADASAVTYSIGCAPGTDSSDCGAGEGFTLIEGPQTAHLEMIDGAASIFTLEDNCIFTGVATAICTETAGGEAANFPGTSVVTYAQEDFTSALIVVTVTAGSGAVLASTGASVTPVTASATSMTMSVSPAVTASQASATTQPASASTGITTAASTGAASSVASEASSVKASSAVSTGGIPQITGNVQWVMGGVAVAMALAGL